MITIVDYGMGNLKSVSKAFEFIGCQTIISSKAEEISKAERLVLPGVGAFGDASKEIESRGLKDALGDFLKTGRPFLGICLGLQLLLETSDESPGSEGLAFFKGGNQRFDANVTIDDERLKVPQIGWNRVKIRNKDCPLFKNIPDQSFFYFVHSFYAVPENRNVVVGETDYGQDFPSALWKENVYATQFHPEKSQKVGLQILKEFSAI